MSVFDRIYPLCALAVLRLGVYIHAVLACDGVSMFSVVDERHVDTNQWRPVCGQDLPSDDGRQASGRHRGRGREESEQTIYG